MRIKEIIGENYWGHWEKTRTACRGMCFYRAVDDSSYGYQLSKKV